MTGKGAGIGSAPDLQPVWQPRHSLKAALNVS